MYVVTSDNDCPRLFYTLFRSEDLHISLTLCPGNLQHNQGGLEIDALGAHQRVQQLPGGLDVGIALDVLTVQFLAAA